MSKAIKKSERTTFSVSKSNKERANTFQRMLAVELNQFLTINDVVTMAFDCLNEKMKTDRDLRRESAFGPQHVFAQQDKDRLDKLERFKRRYPEPDEGREGS
ncbi:MAG: hypothetical protein ACXV5F_10355 [Halobacteriota archaeon]